MIGRRAFGAGALAASVGVGVEAVAAGNGRGTMYGLITQLMAEPGRRDELVRILAAATGAMPGCLDYVVALDAGRDDAIWITEVWRDADSHAASLQLPEVREAMAKGRSLITGMGSRTVTRPVAGVRAGFVADPATFGVIRAGCSGGRRHDADASLPGHRGHVI